MSDYEVCEGCKKLDELRPYGKDGARICFACAQATPASRAIAEAAMHAKFDAAVRDSAKGGVAVVFIGGRDGPEPIVPESEPPGVN